jgi:hypothetical protein
MAETEYTKIGTRGRRRREFFTWNTLWLAKDHMLQIEHTGYSEEYKRFYYRDIQSITVRRDNRALAWTIFFVAMLGIGIAMMLQSDSNGGWFFGLMFASLFTLFLIINLLKGASCISHIKTAVQEDQLPSLRRVKKTDKALAQIRTLVAAAQGSMTSEDIRSRVATIEHGGVPPFRSPATPPVRPMPPPLP